MHAETTSVADAEKLQWRHMIYSACALYYVSVDVGCPAQVWTIRRCGRTAHSELPRSMELTASARTHNLVEVGDGVGNTAFPPTG